MAGCIRVIYSGIVLHDARNVVFVEGSVRVEGGEVVEQSLKDYMIKHLVERDIEEQLGQNWSEERCRVIEFSWTDAPPTAEDAEADE